MTAGTGSILNAATAGAGTNIDISATGSNLLLGSLTAVNDITVSNQGGSILNDGTTGTRLQGNNVKIYSAGSIGASNDFLDTQATTLAFTAANGDANIRDVGTPILNPSSAHNGSVNLSNNLAPTVTRMIGATGAGANVVNLIVRSGDYTVNSTGNARGEEALGFSAEGGNLIMAGNLTANGFNLASTTGNILDGNAGANNITSTGTCTFSAGGYIGTAVDPLEVNINTGSLSVTAHGQSAGASSAISGTILPDNRYSYNSSVPGSIIFNGSDLKAPDIAAANEAAHQAYIDSITLHEKGASLYDMNDKKDTVQQQSATSATSGINVTKIVDFSSYALPNPYNFHISPYLVLPSESKAAR
jgi:hypothetical protein